MRTTKALLIAAVCAVAPAWTFAQTDTLKETDKFIKTGGTTAQAVAQADLQTKNVLSAYNTLVQGSSKDMKGDYKKLQNAQKDMTNEVANARKAIDEMDRQATVYFTARSEAIKHIEDTTMRGQAQSRLDESRKAYDDVRSSLKSGGDALAPFTKDLSDQVKYLGADLTPSAAASLKSQAERLNQQGTTLFSQADTAVSTANKYFSTLKSE